MSTYVTRDMFAGEPDPMQPQFSFTISVDPGARAPMSAFDQLEPQEPPDDEGES